MRTRQFVIVPALIVSLALHALADRVLRGKSEMVEEAGVSDAALVFVSDLQFDALAQGPEAETVRQSETAESVTERPVEPARAQAVSQPVYTAGVKAAAAKPAARSASAPVLPVSDTADPVLAGHVAEVREPDTPPPADEAQTVAADEAEKVASTEKVEQVANTEQAREQRHAPTENLKPDTAEKAESAEAVPPKTVEHKPVEQAALQNIETPLVKPLREETEQPVDVIPVPRPAPAQYREKQARQMAAAEEASKKQAEKPARTKKTSSGNETTGNKGNSTANARKGQQVTGNVADGRNTGVSGNASVSNYPGKIRRKLMRSIRLPRKLNRRHVVTVRFTVTSGGGVSSAVVTRSSGSKDIDGRALQAVHRAAPFPKIPAAAGRKSWQFTIPLEFRAR